MDNRSSKHRRLVTALLACAVISAAPAAADPSPGDEHCSKEQNRGNAECKGYIGKKDNYVWSLPRVKYVHVKDQQPAAPAKPPHQ